MSVSQNDSRSEILASATESGGEKQINQQKETRNFTTNKVPKKEM
jgi:hypothetical protein